MRAPGDSGARPDPLFVGLQTALLGRYSLERELGRGGMGVVYLAREVRLDRPVAIKLLPAELARRDDVRRLLLAEARTAAQLTHPHIVPVFTVEETEGLVYFAMAYIPGETLGSLLRRRGPLPASQAIRWLREIAWALAYAHRCGVVHRDLKPDNVLIEEGSGRSLLSDFGIAQRDGEGTGGYAAGTRGFMSPEQARGAPADARSDVFAFGVTAWFALTGRMPEDGASELLPDLPRWLGDLLRRCLDPDPARRPADGAELINAFEHQPDESATLPPVLRRWLTRATPFRRVFMAWSVFFGFITLASSVLPAFTRLDLLYWLGITFAPWLLVLPMRLLETQRALAAGYALADLRTALRLTLRQRREELLADFYQDQKALPGLRRKVLLVVLGLGGALFVAIRLVLRTDQERAGLAGWSPFFFTLTAVLLLVALGLRRRTAPPRDLGAEFRAWLWQGPAGEWMVWLAAQGIRRPAVSAAFAQRPTEVILGQAAQGLFEALSPELRRALADYPATIRKLEEDAARLRELLDAVRDHAVESGTPARIEAQHQAVIEALESLRLGLLRLHGGSGSVGSVTTGLEAAESLGREVDRLVGAQSEVRRLLHRPTGGR